MQRQQIDSTRFTNDELMKYLGWSVDDYITARYGCGLPKADGWRDTTGNLFSVGANSEPTRRKVDVASGLRNPASGSRGSHGSSAKLDEDKTFEMRDTRPRYLEAQEVARGERVRS
jgi:hypothetical protein